MRALYCSAGEARLVERPTPRAGDDDVRIRVLAAGICNTDLELVRGYMGFEGVLGHEVVGIVEEGPAAWLGRRVVAEINFACGDCAWCSRGLGRHCPTRSVMGILNADGGIADYVAVPIANLHAVPDELATEDAVFVEPLAAAFEITAQVPIERGQRCLVLGDGKLGLLAAQVLADRGAAVLAVGRHPEKLAILARRDIETTLSRDWRREPADVVVEATGRAEGLGEAIAVTRPRGTLVLKSTVAEPVAANLAPLVINEVTVVGSRCGLFPPAIEALAQGRIDVRSLVTARMPLSEAVDALERAAQPGALKVLIEP